MSDGERIQTAAAPSAFRVIRLGEPLRQDLRSRREATGQTVRAFLAEALEFELPALVAALGELGVTEQAAAGSAGRPARLPLSAAHLEGLRAAAASTGLPASLLLRVALARLARRKRRRPGAAHNPTTAAGTRGKAGAPATGAKGSAHPQRRGATAGATTSEATEPAGSGATEG